MVSVKAPSTGTHVANPLPFYHRRFLLRSQKSLFYVSRFEWAQSGDCSLGVGSMLLETGSYLFKAMAGMSIEKATPGWSCPLGCSFIKSNAMA